jgi:hypothetical protein
MAATVDIVFAIGGELVKPISAGAPEITTRFRNVSGKVIGL